ncbi:hypothetical protein GCM10008179_18770 [Hansschlegelia plantiphila]|uniref:Uncharacterized protein n=1 Tax=Hansschlegelia plantiphila TaxID=374655 RepID=A0A9W6J2L2_9HYPH|nr:hypothetical protein GCM10008179_18770 [Hansschlegelia plantiphila]
MKVEAGIGRATCEGRFGARCFERASALSIVAKVAPAATLAIVRQDARRPPQLVTQPIIIPVFPFRRPNRRSRRIRDSAVNDSDETRLRSG